MGFSRFDKVVGKTGVYTGAYGAEVQALNAAGVAVKNKASVIVAFTYDSAAQTVYVACPVTGEVDGVTFVQGTAVVTTTITVKAGSAGTNIATATMTSVAVGIASAVALSTGGTAVTAGQVIGVARTGQTTAGVNSVTISIVPSA